MPARRHLLAMYAHPDDEAFGAAGSLALLRERGVEVTLVCATRGEVGQISDPSLATPETLGAVREAELISAMAKVGVEDVRLLAYRDSGMEGSEEALHPQAFVRADPAGVTGELLAILHEVQPDSVLTFGPEGVYGHPDHLMIHRAATAAVVLANGASLFGNPIGLYYNATPRERLQRMAQRKDGPFRGMPPELLAKLGTPEAEVTTVVDVTSRYDDKMAAILSHRTQIAPDGPFQGLPRDEVREYLRIERFKRAPLPYEVAPDRWLLDWLASS